MEIKMIEKLARLIELSSKFKMYLGDCVELPEISISSIYNGSLTCSTGYIRIDNTTSNIVVPSIEYKYIEAIEKESNDRITKIKEYYEYTTLLEEFKAYTDSLLKLNK